MDLGKIFVTLYKIGKAIRCGSELFDTVVTTADKAKDLIRGDVWEDHPDKISPAYRAESMPDGIRAIRAWHDYIVTFGVSSIEFFGLTGGTDPIYAQQSSYTANVGICGREAVAEFADSFGFVTSPSCGVAPVR